MGGSELPAGGPTTAAAGSREGTASPATALNGSDSGSLGSLLGELVDDKLVDLSDPLDLGTAPTSPPHVSLFETMQSRLIVTCVDAHASTLLIMSSCVREYAGGKAGSFLYRLHETDCISKMRGSCRLMLLVFADFGQPANGEQDSLWSLVQTLAS